MNRVLAGYLVFVGLIMVFYIISHVGVIVYNFPLIVASLVGIWVFTGCAVVTNLFLI